MAPVSGWMRIRMRVTTTTTAKPYMVSTMQADATIFIIQFLRFRMRKSLRCFQNFRPFWHATNHHHPFPIFQLIFIRPSLAARYTSSDPPTALFTSTFGMVVAYIAVAQSWTPEKDSWHNSAPGPVPSTTNSVNHLPQPRAMKLPIGWWNTLGHVRCHAQCD